MFKGLPEKVGNEVKRLAPKHMRVKLQSPPGRKQSCWQGASIMTSLGSFNNMWITKNEFFEKGDKVLFTKTV